MPKTVKLDVGIWYNETTHHIHIAAKDRFISTVSLDRASKRFHPNLYRKLAVCLRDAGAPAPEEGRTDIAEVERRRTDDNSLDGSMVAPGGATNLEPHFSSTFAASIPAAIRPTGSEAIELIPGGAHVSIPKATPLFSRWAGALPDDTYNRKPVLNVDGEMVFAELAILRLFQKAGWDGRWVDSYRNRFLTGYWPTPSVEALPARHRDILQSIRAKAGRAGGCFDVICWREDALLFVEAKRRGKDRIHDNQRHWLRTALGLGIPLESFLIAEWDFAP